MALGRQGILVDAHQQERFVPVHRLARLARLLADQHVAAGELHLGDVSQSVEQFLRYDFSKSPVERLNVAL